MLALIEPTGVQVLDAFLGVRLDISAVDPDGWRAEGTGLFDGLLIGDVEYLDLSVAAKLCADPLDQRWCGPPRSGRAWCWPGPGGGGAIRPGPAGPTTSDANPHR